MTELLRLLLAVAAAYLMGKLVSKLKLPAILGWLLTGMVLGPHALGLVDQALLDAEWYNVAESVMECTAGLMIGTELVWKRMRRSGAQIVVMTLAESLGTFVCVAAVFAAIFAFTGTPLYLALVFGGIALATAPAPSPATKPARRASNGSEAWEGSSAFDSAPRFENPARQMGDTDSSEPPASAASM